MHTIVLDILNTIIKYITVSIFTALNLYKQIDIFKFEMDFKISALIQRLFHFQVFLILSER